MFSASGTMRFVKRCTTRTFGGIFLSATSLSSTRMTQLMSEAVIVPIFAPGRTPSLSWCM